MPLRFFKRIINSIFPTKKIDIVRYSIIGIIFILAFILTWNHGGEIHIAHLGLFMAAAITIKLPKRFIADIIFPIYAFIVAAYFQHALSTFYSIQVFTLETRSIFKFISEKQDLTCLVIELMVIFGLYFLARACKASPNVAAVIAPTPTIILCLANFFVLKFRGNELGPMDFMSAGTAMNVMGNYSFPFKEPFVLVYAPFTFYYISVIRMKVPKSKFKLKGKIIESVIFAILSISIAVGMVFTVKKISETKLARHWGDEASMMNGYITNFALLLNEMNVEAPAGYDKNNYANLYAVPEVTQDPDVNIIVIMNESYADFDVHERLVGTYDNPDPYWDSLKNDDNVRAGYAYASVFGGTTANSEFEMLTGLSVAGLPIGTVPYSMYVSHPIYSFPRYLSELGYTTTAMHPYKADGWNRPTVYPNLGFDSMMFIDDFDYTDDDIVRGSANLDEDLGFISDECAYNNLLNVIDSNETGKPGFYFLVTIQNHGGYDPAREEIEPLGLAHGTFSDAQFDVYLSNLRRSDEALEMLIDELSSRDEKYVVLIYGDHQPLLDITTPDNMPEGYGVGGAKWIVPYLIWTNYDMPKDYSGPSYNTSINYFALDLFNVTGLPKSEYFTEIEEIRNTFRIVYASGWLDPEVDFWHAYQDLEAFPDLNALYNRYLGIQYYTLFDSKEFK